MPGTSLRKKFLIVLGSTILSVVGPNILNYSTQGDKNDLFIAFLSFCLLFHGFGLTEFSLSQLLLIIRRNRRKRSIAVGTLKNISYSHRDHCVQRVWTDRPPEEWGNLIRQEGKKQGVKIISRFIYSKSYYFDLYDVIINPFGSNYPEDSFDGFPTYNKILRYIRRGGIFVNVSDIPTYYAYNPVLRKKLDRTPINT